MKIFNPSPKDSITFRNISWIFRKENVTWENRENARNVCYCFYFSKKERADSAQPSSCSKLHSKKACSALLRKIWDCNISTLLPCVCSNFFHFFLGFDIWILIEIWNKNQQKSLQVSKNNLLAIKRYFWWTFWILTNDYVI